MPEPRFTALLAFLEREEEAARRMVAARERERDQLIARRQSIEDGRATAAAAAATPALREQLARYWTWSAGELQGLHKALAACDERIAGARTALSEAHRQVRTFTRLRERDQRAELARRERRFAAELDEFAATRTAAARDGQESAP